MTRPQANAVDNRAMRMVWMLTLAGILAGVVIVGTVSVVVLNLQRAGLQLEAVRSRGAGIDDSIREELIKGQQDIVQLMESSERNAGDGVWLGQLDSKLTAIDRSDVDPVLVNSIARLNACVTHMRDARAQLASWHTDHLQVAAEASRLHGDCDAMIRQMRGSVQIAIGRERLQQTIAVRRFRKATGEDAHKQAAEIAGSFDVGNTLSPFLEELSELALGCESLYGEQNIDKLADIKDNRLTACFNRIGQALSRAGKHAELVTELTTTTEALKTKLFGEGYAVDTAHQTIEPGTSGLFPLCAQRLALQQRGQQLHAQAKDRLEQCHAALDLVGSAGQLLASRVTRETERSLMRAWWTAFAVVGVCGVLFIALATRIASSLRQQIRLIEDTNRSLDHARMEAQAASRSKSDFLANMSHEIRTPMTAIVGYADLLTDPQQSPSDRLDCIQTVRRNGEHLLAIINDILDVSKIEAGKMTVERINTRIPDIVADVTSLMRGKAIDKDLTLSADYQGAFPATVCTDPTRLRQILINLIGNAIKFTATGGVRLSVRYLPSPSEPRIAFHIADTGIGLTPDQINKLFNPFTQADSSTTRKFGGTGLGLTISRSLTKLLGGDITVSSIPNHGTTFIVTIDPGPLHNVPMIQHATEIEVTAPRFNANTDTDTDDQPANPHADALAMALTRTSPAAEPAMQTKPLQDLRILLAEDGPDNQRLIAFHLKKAGAQVVIAADGRLAVDAVNAALAGGTPHDVVLMDMQMPNLDGYGAASLLRQQGCLLPIIALTAHAMADDRAKCLNAGCSDYLTKPIDREKLINTIRAHIQQQRQQGQPTPQLSTHRAA